MAASATKVSRLSRAKRDLRTANGAYLIELLFAILIAGFLTAILGNSLSEIMRLTTKTDRTMLAYAIAQEVIDRVRATPYSEIPIGETQIQINSPDTDSTPASGLTPIAKRPLQIDTVNLKWGNLSNSGGLPNYRFAGSVKLIVATHPEILAKTALVSVEWTDSENNAQMPTHKVQAGTLVSPYGLSRHE